MSDLALKSPTPPKTPRSQARTALMAFGLAIGMLGLGFASVPLYRLFCQVTGFGGTTMRATAVPTMTAQQKVEAATRTFSIRFDSNVQPGMPWQFKPERNRDTVTVGAKDMAVYIAKNMSDKPVTGTATFNVTPTQAGKYFSKIQCFCFTEQTLQPGQEIRMPVLYFVDPKILDDKDNIDVEEITLSYTFYPVEKPGEQR